METTGFNQLLLQTAFCCMACDGEIAPEEVELVKSICKETLALQCVDFEKKINTFISDVNADSKHFLSTFIKTVKDKVPDLTEQEEFDLIDISIKVIKADKKIEYSEIKFFKIIRYCLKVNDERVMEHFSETVEDIELFLGEDIHTEITLEDITQQYFNVINFDELRILDTE